VRQRNSETGRVLIPAVLVHTLLMLVRNAHAPIARESVFIADARSQRIRRVIVRIDQRARPTSICRLRLFTALNASTHPF